MRVIGAMFGLLGLLIVVAIMLWLGSMYSIPAARQGRAAQQQVKQQTGYDATGIPVSDTIVLRENPGEFSTLTVESIIPGASIQKHFGLQTGDVITRVAGLRLTDVGTGSDAELAKAMVIESYQRQQELTVVRNGQEITLPQRGAPAAATPAGNPPGTAGPAAPANAPPAPAKPAGNSPYDQVEAIRQQLGAQ